MTNHNFNPSTITLLDEPSLSDEQLDAVARQNPIVSVRESARRELVARRRARLLVRARDTVLVPLRERVIRAKAKSQIELHLSLDVIEILLMVSDEAMKAWKIDPKGG